MGAVILLLPVCFIIHIIFLNSRFNLKDLIFNGIFY